MRKTYKVSVVMTALPINLQYSAGIPDTKHKNLIALPFSLSTLNQSKSRNIKLKMPSKTALEGLYNIYSLAVSLVPPTGFEPVHSAPEADALSI